MKLHIENTCILWKSFIKFDRDDKFVPGTKIKHLSPEEFLKNPLA